MDGRETAGSDTGGPQSPPVAPELIPSEAVLRTGHFTVEPARTMQADGHPWPHEIRVALPSTYMEATTRTYPVLWVTDNRLEAALPALGDAQLIVVSVGRGHAGRMGVLATARVRLLRGRRHLPRGNVRRLPGVEPSRQSSVPRRRRPRFLDFLIDDVRPALAAQYRMDPDEHGLEGYSAGGWFVVYGLLTRPGAFSKYLAGAPALSFCHQLIFEIEAQYAAEHDDLAGHLFTGAGDGEMTVDPELGCFSSMAAMVELLSFRSYPSLQLTVKILPGESHQTALPGLIGPGATSAVGQADRPAGAVTPVLASVPGDATYGYTLPRLLEVAAPEPPADFESFWRGLYARSRAIDPAAAVVAHAAASGSDRVVHDVTFRSLDGVRLGGWLSLPARGPVARGLVVGHGYSGRGAPDPELPVDDAAVLFFCARGLPARGVQPGIPDTMDLHVLHGISARETYVHRGCVADAWCAISALIQLVPEAAARIAYLGGSFGGGLGALALPWDDRVDGACLVVPSLGQLPLRLTLPCAGSGEAVRRHVQRHPEVVDVLRYFDAATAAKFVRTPTHVGLALADLAVPPPGQFAIFNALAGPRERFLMTRGHVEHPGSDDEAAALLASQRDFREPLFH